MASPADNQQPVGEEKIGLDSSSSHQSRNSSLQIPTKTSDLPAWQVGDPPTELVIVPRLERRGLFGTLTLLPEVEDARTYSNRVKWFLTFIIAVAGAAGPTGSAIFYRACREKVFDDSMLTTNTATLPELAVDLHATPTITNLSVAFYMASMAICPLWWSSFSEWIGRRTVYLVSFTFFVIWTILSANSTSIGMLIATRILGGGAAASVQAVGGGSIADIWESKDRGKAMGIFYLGPLCGPLLAPIIGGSLAQKWGWRSTQWFLAIYGGVLIILVLFGLPETLKNQTRVVAAAEHEVEAKEKKMEDKSRLRPTVSRASSRHSIQAQTKKWAVLARRLLFDPLRILIYLRFPAVLITVYYSSITFGSLFVLNISIQDTFSKAPYNFSTIIIGLLYLPSSLGYVLSSIFGGRWTDYIMQREARAAGRFDANGKLILIPEDRMRENAWIAAFMYPSALIWYGWAADKGVHWIVPVSLNISSTLQPC
jgi:multidrug resistance protein